MIATVNQANIHCDRLIKLPRSLPNYQVIQGHGNPQKRRTMFISYLFKYCSPNYQKFHQIFENTC